MKISTKGRYALRMLCDLAERGAVGSEKYVALKDIAESQDISKKYLEQIVTLLTRNQLLLTNRGYQGGYMLSKPPEDYTVGEILRVTEGSLAPVACLTTDKNTCPRADKCKTLFVWEGLEKVIYEYLDSISLKDILDNQCGSSDFDDDKQHHC